MSNNTLKKIDIIKDLSKKTGYPLNYSKKIINDLVETIIQSIKLGQLNLKNIGSFKIINKNERIGRNPKTKEIFKITSRKSISFSSSKNLKKFFNKNG